jgi:hypothetical protein
MANPVELVKKHPVAIIGGVCAIGLVLLIMQNSGAAATTSGGSADPNAVLAASTQVQLAQIQVGGVQAQAGYQLALDQQDNEANLAIANLNAQLQQLQITNNTQLQTLQAQLSATLQTHMSDNDLASTINNNQTAYNIQQSNNATTLGIITTESNANVTMAGINAAAAIAQNAANNATATAIAQFNSQVQIAMSHDQLSAIQSTNSMLQHNSNNGLFGSIFGTIGAVAGAFI